MSNEPNGGLWAVETVDLSRSFGRRQALDGVNLRVSRGSIFGLLGLNGAGKSTLLRILIGHVRADRGEVRLLNKTVQGDDPDIRSRIGYLSDQQYLYDWMSVAECISFTAAFYKTWDMAKAYLLLRRFDLQADQKIHSLSRGQRARLSMVTVLSYNPELLILDEPTSSLDPAVRRDVLEQLVAAAESGTTVLFSSHIVEEVERIADNVGIIHFGRLFLTASVAELKEQCRLVRFSSDSPINSGDLPGLMRLRSFGREQAGLFWPYHAEAQQCLLSMGARGISLEIPTLEEIFLNLIASTDGKTSGPEIELTPLKMEESIQ
jgi:ABC-2 type transport system ATP-binding protein